MPLMLHYDEEQLETYAMGRMLDADAAEAEEHLLVCEHCQEKLERVDDFIRAFRIASHNQPAVAAARAAAVAAGSLEAARQPGLLARWLGTGWRPMRLAGALAMAALAVVMVAPRQERADSQVMAGPAETASLSAMRGAGVGYVSANRRVDLDLDAAGLDGSLYRVELADGHGRRLWSASLPVRQGRIPAAVPRRLSEGVYWVRLYEPGSGQLVREFGLQAR